MACAEDRDLEKTEVRWYRWDREEKQLRFHGNNGPSWDDLSEEARDNLVRVYSFVLEKHREKERRGPIERNADLEGY